MEFFQYEFHTLDNHLRLQISRLRHDTMRVKLSPDEKRLYVSNGRAGTISVFDSHTYELLDTIKVGARPWGIGVSPDGKFLFAANGPSNDVSVVDLKTNKELSRIKAGSSPWGIAITSR